MLKTGDYDLWSMRMEQYLTYTDYALWKVIINDDSPIPEPLAVGTVVPPKTRAQKLARKNKLEAKSTLLLAIPDEHLLKFHLIKDTKSFREAIKISQLKLNGEVISQQDANMKLLRSLPLAWNNIALIMRNKLDIETLSIDDLYNNFKVNDQEQIQALVDKKKVIITEDIIRSDLCFDDAEGTACLLTEAIFEGLVRMGRIGAGFSKVITPLFDTMMVQAPADMGDTLVETHQTPIVDQPSTSKPQKKQKPRRKQRKEAELSNDESKYEDHVPTPSKAKAAQAKKIAALKKKITKLNKWRKSRSGGLRRLKKFGSDKRVKPPMEKDKIALDYETQERSNDDEIFRVDDLAGEEVVMDTTTSEHEEQIIEDVSTAEPVTTADEVVTTTTIKDSAAPTIDQEMSTTIPVASTTVTIAVPTPRAKGIVFHEQKQSKIHTVSSSKDKGKAKMIEPEVLIKKKDQMWIDEEYAKKLEAAEQEEEFSKVQKARLLVELIEKRKKHFATLRAQEKRNKPPTKTQMKIQISTYLKHMGGYKQSHLKGKSFDEIKKLFDREIRKVNDFIAMDSEAQESSTKRTTEHLESNISKKQKVDENVEPVINDSDELKNCMEIVFDDLNEFTTGRLVNGSSCDGIDMVIKDLDLEPKDIIAEFCGSSRWNELKKETSSKILPCGDGSS
nr:hypothetical protein [Tanacetum cinerariifolium]